MSYTVTVKEVLNSIGGPFEIDDNTYEGDEVLGKARVRISGIAYAEDNVIRLHDPKTPVIVGRARYEYEAQVEGEEDMSKAAHKHLEEYGRTLKPKVRNIKKK